MRNTVTRKIALVLMLLVLAVPITASLVTAAPGGMADSRREHPRLTHAIKDLNNAIDYLQKAPHDFGGHRAEAVEACKNAVAQLQKALQYDK